MENNDTQPVEMEQEEFEDNSVSPFHLKTMPIDERILDFPDPFRDCEINHLI